MKNQEVFMILFKEVLEGNLRSNKDQVLEIINDFFKNNRKDDLILVNNDYHETSSGLLNYNVINFKSSYLMIYLYYLQDKSNYSFWMNMKFYKDIILIKQ